MRDIARAREGGWERTNPSAEPAFTTEEEKKNNLLALTQCWKSFNRQTTWISLKTSPRKTPAQLMSNTCYDFHMSQRTINEEKKVFNVLNKCTGLVRKFSGENSRFSIGPCGNSVWPTWTRCEIWKYFTLTQFFFLLKWLVFDLIQHMLNRVTLCLRKKVWLFNFIKYFLQKYVKVFWCPIIFFCCLKH